MALKVPSITRKNIPKVGTTPDKRGFDNFDISGNFEEPGFEQFGQDLFNNQISRFDAQVKGQELVKQEGERNSASAAVFGAENEIKALQQKFPLNTEDNLEAYSTGIADITTKYQDALKDATPGNQAAYQTALTKVFKTHELVANKARIDALDAGNLQRAAEDYNESYADLVTQNGNIAPDPNGYHDAALARIELLMGGSSDAKRITAHTTNMQSGLVNRVNYLQTLPNAAAEIEKLMASPVGRTYGDDAFFDATRTALSESAKISESNSKAYLEAHKLEFELKAKEDQRDRLLKDKSEYVEKGTTPEDRARRAADWVEASSNAGLLPAPITLNQTEGLSSPTGKELVPVPPLPNLVVPGDSRVATPAGEEKMAVVPPPVSFQNVPKGGTGFVFDPATKTATQVDTPGGDAVEFGANPFVIEVEGDDGKPQKMLTNMGSNQVSKTIAGNLGRGVDEDTGAVVGLEGKEIQFHNTMQTYMSEAMIEGAVSPSHAYDIALERVPMEDRPETIDYRALGLSIISGQAPPTDHESAFVTPEFVAGGDSDADKKNQASVDALGAASMRMLNEIKAREISLNHATGPISAIMDKFGSLFGGYFEGAVSDKVSQARFEYAVLVRNFIEIMALNNRFPIAEQKMLMVMIPGPDFMNVPKQAAQSMKGFRVLLADRIEARQFELGTKLPVSEKNDILNDLKNLKKIEDRLGRFNIDNLDGREAVTYHEFSQKPSDIILTMKSPERKQVIKDLGPAGVRRLRREDPDKFKALTGEDAIQPTKPPEEEAEESKPPPAKTQVAPKAKKPIAAKDKKPIATKAKKPVAQKAKAKAKGSEPEEDTKGPSFTNWIRQGSGNQSRIDALNVPGAVTAAEFGAIFAAEMAEKDVYSDDRISTILADLKSETPKPGKNTELKAMLVDIITAEAKARNIKGP